MDAQLYTSLSIVRQLIEIEQHEAIDALLAGLHTYNNDGQLRYILAALENGRFRDALLLIQDFETQSRAVSQVYDPIVSALQVELHIAEETLVEANADCLELMKLIHNFQVHFHNALDPFLERLLYLKKEKAHIMALLDPRLEEQYKQSQEELERFLKERENGPVGLLYGLDEAQSRELKMLFRRGAFLCHPDTIDESQRQRAREMFEEMHQAYRDNDLRKLRLIVELLEKTGSFQTGKSHLDDAGALRSKISLIMLQTEEKQKELERIKASGAFHTIQNTGGDWQSYFAQMAQNLQMQIQEIETWMHFQSAQN